MSYYFRALSRRIPELLLLARPGSGLILVSPWLQNVLLQPPSFGSGATHWEGSTLRLGEFLVRMSREYHHPVTVLVRSIDQRTAGMLNDFALSSVPAPRLLEVPHLHAKAIVTDAFALSMSANLLTTSLSRNVETCVLTTNPYGSASQWVERELGIHLAHFP